MDNATVQSILSNEFNASIEAGVYTVDDKRKLTVLVQQGQGVMSVQNVRHVRFEDAFVAVSTEDDVYFLEPTSLLGLKGANPEVDKDEKRPGFRR